MSSTARSVCTGAAQERISAAQACARRPREHAVSGPEIRRRIALIYPWLTTSRVIALVCVLFFGSDEHDLTTFVLQDLGVWRFETVSGAQTRPFARRADLDLHLAIGELRGGTYPCGESTERRARRGSSSNCGCASRIESSNDGVPDCSTASAPQQSARAIRHRVDGVREIGHRVCARTKRQTHCAARRRVRCTARLRACARRPAACRARFRRAVSTGAATGSRASASGDDIDARAHCASGPRCRARGAVDAARAWRYRRAPRTVFSLALFGLAFWDVVFAPIRGAFSALTSVVRSISLGGLRAARRLDAARLEKLDSHDVLRARVQETWCAKWRSTTLW
jgi:hypothetical protein